LSFSPSQAAIQKGQHVAIEPLLLGVHIIESYVALAGRLHGQV
jgi:hypothetical protein